MQNTDNDVHIVEVDDTVTILMIGKDRYRISNVPDETWEPVMDRTWMNKTQLFTWLSDNKPRSKKK